MQIPMMQGNPDKLSLELKTLPNFDYLSVFIRDPADPEVYHLRKYHITLTEVRPVSKARPAADSEEVPLADGSYEMGPISDEDLDDRVREVLGQEREVGRDSSRKHLRSSVAIARYEGDDIYSPRDFQGVITMQFARQKNQKFRKMR